MALTDNPYLPLYVRDWLTSNKLSTCSALSLGVLINIMCVMHRENEYGKILLKQKFKQKDKQILNFALQLAKMVALDVAELDAGITELIDENVLVIEGDFLINPRMVKDAEISGKRAISGSKGGEKTQKNNNKFALHFAKPNFKANSDIENKNENEIQEEERGMGEEGEKLLKHKDEPENWRLEVSRFLVDAKFKFDFCAAKKINIIDLEKRMNDFVIDLNLKMDYKDAPALKRHFINHYRKHVEQAGIGVKDFKKEQTAFIEPPSIDFDSENIVRW